jgi:hypothetical protein
MYSIERLSSEFCERSRNWRDFAYKDMNEPTPKSVSRASRAFIMKAPIKRYAGAFRRRFEVTDRNVRVPGMRRACNIGFNICMGGISPLERVSLHVTDSVV